MKFLEKNLEQIIWESDKQTLRKRGLELNGKLLRQVKIGNYGISDLICYERPRSICDVKYNPDGVIRVFELKKDKISVETFLQAVRYVRGIKSYLNFRDSKIKNCRFEIVLIGSSIDLDTSFCYLTDFTEDYNFNVKFYTYEYGIDGLFFMNKKDFKLKDEGFKIKDKKKYIF
jgi:hypothetical protein